MFRPVMAPLLRIDLP